MEEIKKKRHIVEIRNDLYERIKEYCQLNNLKPAKFINEMLEKSFMIELYGETPFTILSKKIQVEEIDPEIQRAINDNFWEMLGDDEKDKPQKYIVPDAMVEEVENSITPPKNESIEQNEKEAQKVIDEHMQKLEQKNNKPTKRRLK